MPSANGHSVMLCWTYGHTDRHTCTLMLLKDFNANFSQRMSLQLCSKDCTNDFLSGIHLFLGAPLSLLIMNILLFEHNTTIIFESSMSKMHPGKSPQKLVSRKILNLIKFLMHSVFSGRDESGGTGLIISLQLFNFPGTPGWQELYNDVSSYWIKLPRARLHWAKLWPSLPDINKGFIRNVSSFLVY